MNTIFTLLMSFLLLPAHAEMKSAKALSTTADDKSLTGRLKEGYHFNEKAPNQVRVDGQVVKPAKLTAREISFNFPPPKTAGEASLYVCDDAVTFCETHYVKLAGSAPVAKAKAPKNPHKGRVDAAGFIEDDLAKALKTAKSKNRLVLVDFGAQWCPGCVRYESETFPGESFRKMSSDFVKAKIDTDRFENVEISQKYQIKGIPSLIVMDGEGREVSRIVDYQPNDKLQAFLLEARNEPTPIGELRKKAETDPAARLTLARRLLASGQAAASVPLFEKITPAPVELLNARVQAAEEAANADEKNKPAFAEALRAAIRAEPEGTRSLNWRTQLAGVLDPKSDEVRKVREDGVKLADALLADRPKMMKAFENDAVGEFTGQERFLVAIARADLIESSGAEPAVAKAAWSRAADIGREENVAAMGAGPARRYLAILGVAERWEESEKLADSLLAKDPKNFDVRRRKVKILTNLKKYPEAIKLGESLMKEAHGRNEFWVAEGLAKAYVGARKNAEARKVLQAALSREEMNTERMQGSRKSMEALLKETEAPAAR